MHTSPISSIAAYGHYIATSGYDNQVILWESITKDFIGRGMHDHLANKVIFSPDGNFLLSASSDYTVRLWSIPDLRLKTLFGGHTDDVENISFSSDGKHIATASRDNSIRIFDLQGHLIRKLDGHTADALSVTWAKDDRQLISSGDDGTIRIWNSGSGKEIQCFSFDEVETDTCGIYKGFIYAGNDKGQIIVIETNTGKINNTINAHTAGIKSIVIHEKFKLILSSSYDKKIKIWKINDLTGEITIEKIIDSIPIIWLRATAIVQQNLLAFGSFGSCYATYNLDHDEWNFTKIQNTNGINAAIPVNCDIYTVGDAGTVYKSGSILSVPGSLCNFLINVGENIFTGGQTGQLFDASTGTSIYEHHSPLNCGTVFEYDKQTFVLIGSYTGEAILFQYIERKLIFKQLLVIHTNAIKGITSNSKYLFSVAANRDAAFYDIKSLKLIKYINKGHTLIANGCDYIDDYLFVSISRDKILRLWKNFSLNKEIETPHTHSIKCVKVATHNRSLIATGSYNGMVCIYNLAMDQWEFTKRLTSSGISSLSYDNHSNNFIASSYDGQIYRIQV